MVASHHARSLLPSVQGQGLDAGNNELDHLYEPLPLYRQRHVLTLVLPDSRYLWRRNVPSAQLVCFIRQEVVQGTEDQCRVSILLCDIQRDDNVDGTLTAATRHIEGIDGYGSGSNSSPTGAVDRKEL